MHYPKFLRYIDSLHTRIMERPAWVRALWIIGIALVAAWLVAMGIQWGLDTLGLEPLYEGVNYENPQSLGDNAEDRQLIWQRYGLLLSALSGLMVALFLHSLIGSPTLYSDISRVALGLQLAAVPLLFNGLIICVCGLPSFCLIPIVAFVGVIHGIRFRGRLWPPAGDWVVFALYIVYTVILWNYYSAWSDVLLGFD